ncbi:MAG: metallophosphoesterase [Lachnoclostridium sp.]|jgi:putative phosphoesterase|nr:metallophosphoesterase [Lachnoclostridium sp.]
MRYLIVSDSHGKNKNLFEVLENVAPIEAVFHLGDLGMPIEVLESIAECPVYSVAGNCDYNSNMESEQVVEIEGHRVAMTHGHMHRVNYSFDKVLAWGKSQGAEVVMFGHTHEPLHIDGGGITVINPGSIEEPRQSSGIPTYAVMEIDEKGEFHFTMNEVGDFNKSRIKWCGFRKGFKRVPEKH